MRKIIFIILYYINFHKLLIILKKKRLITLMLHRINPKIDSIWPSLTPSTFEKLIKILMKNSLIVSIHDFQKINSNKLKFILTFDDGYKDFYIYALPILTKYNISSNLNICPKLIDENEIPWTQKINILIKSDLTILKKIISKYNIKLKNNIFFPKDFNELCSQIMSLKNKDYINLIKELNNSIYSYPKEIINWNEIKECSKKGVIIGNHSNSHMNLDKLKLKLINDEIYKSKLIIENNLNKNINIFSLPNGKSNNDIIKMLKIYYKYILFSNDTGEILYNDKTHILLDRINLSINDEYEEFFRAIGFHNFVKKLINFFFKHNNKTR